ncbi:hypothetical protein [Hydrogenophaga sp.]|uniref:hypothetical protein n=1 Tax=Hydrogenophaga sp. TaxID=1904254 RepID=UPI003D2A4A11
MHLELASAETAPQVRVVVISHDCDLANDNLNAEPEVEVLVGGVVAAMNGSFAWGKSPRTLHLQVQKGEGSEVLELVQTTKRRVPKTELAKFLPSAEHSMDQPGLSTLRSWLATRYNRAAFADTFVNRLRAAEADERLSRLLKPSGDLISFVYFRMEGGHTVEREDGDPYAFNIVLVFNPGEDAEASADRADALAEKVEADLQGRLKDPSSVVLKSCMAISEDDVSVGQAKVLTQWRLEHMTLRADEPQPGPPEL